MVSLVPRPSNIFQPDFSRVTLKNIGRPGYEAIYGHSILYVRTQVAIYSLGPVGFVPCMGSIPQPVAPSQSYFAHYLVLLSF